MPLSPSQLSQEFWIQTIYFRGYPRHHKWGNRKGKTGKRKWAIKYALTRWIPLGATGMWFHWGLCGPCLKITLPAYKEAEAFSSCLSTPYTDSCPRQFFTQAFPNCSHVHHLGPICFWRKGVQPEKEDPDTQVRVWQQVRTRLQKQ